MTQKERTEIKELTKDMNEFREEMNNMKGDIKEILSILRDDPNSTSEGLVSRVNRIERSTNDLKEANRLLKRIMVFVGTVTTALVIYWLKIMLFGA